MNDAVVPIFSPPLTWSSAIGLFLLNFSTLEMQSFAYLEKHLPSPEFEKWKKRSLDERLTRIGEIFASTQDQRIAFTAFIQRLDPVRELRNHIAHGFLQLVIKPGEQGHVIGITQAKDLNTPFSPTTRHVEFSELQAALKELDALIQEFDQLTK